MRRIYDLYRETCTEGAVRGVLSRDGFALYRQRHRPERCLLVLKTDGEPVKGAWVEVSAVPHGAFDLMVSERSMLEQAIRLEFEELQSITAPKPCDLKVLARYAAEVGLTARLYELDGVFAPWDLLDLDAVLWPSGRALPTISDLFDIWQVLHFVRRAQSDRDYTGQSFDIMVQEMLYQPGSPRELALRGLARLSYEERLHVQRSAMEAALEQLPQEQRAVVEEAVRRLQTARGGIRKLGRWSALEVIAKVGWVLAEERGL